MWRGRWRLPLAPMCAVIICAGSLQAQVHTVPEDTLDPLLARLASWVDANLSHSYGYAAVASGAALSVGYSADTGYHLPTSLKLLWPGNLISVADPTYVAVQPQSVSAAQKELLSTLKQGRGVLLQTSQPVYVYRADSSFGEPWFFAATGGMGRPDTVLWDAGDLKRNWWHWCDDPGANTIWPQPVSLQRARGKAAVLAGLRHCVLSARPLKGTVATGLAAYQAMPSRPGSPAELLRLAALRMAAARYLQSELELWPPAEREPLKLTIYYLEKAALSFRELAESAAEWELTSDVRREELVSALSSHETGAAMALDGLVSPKQ